MSKGIVNMRLKEFFYLLGLKPNYQFYGYEEQDVLVEGHAVQFAKWLAPKMPPLAIEPHEMSELRSFIREGDFAIDVGAHVGDSTLPIALACGASGAVLALEPNPATFAILAANSALNPGKTNIIAMPFAATAQDCTMTFDYGDPWLSNGGDHTGVSKWRHGSAFSIPVRGKNINELLREKFSHLLKNLRYIKIDVEGNDFSVVQSLASVIEEFRPHIKLEVGRPTSEADRHGIAQYFQAQNYALHLVVNRKTLFGPLLANENLFGAVTIDVFAIPQ